MVLPFLLLSALPPTPAEGKLNNNAVMAVREPVMMNMTKLAVRERSGVMKVTMALLLLLAVVGMCVFTGCSGDDDDDDDIIIPNALQGTWLLAVSETGGAPVGGALVNVAANGRVTAYRGTQVGSAQLPVILGEVSPTGVLDVSAEFDDVTYNVDGTLKTDDTGSGTWEAVGGDPEDPTSGTFVACRADGGEFAGTWTGTVSGDYSGTQDIDVSSTGVITGNVEVNGVVAPAIGVINGADDILGIWDPNDEDAPVVFANGSATSANDASGTWSADNGAGGTWEASRQIQ